MERPTLDAVGRACGVSASTVSRCFTRPDVVSAAVRERVLATAEAMGYRPNKLARGLATGRLGRIGLLVPDVANPFFSELLRVVQHVALSRANCSVLIVDSDERPSDEADLIAGLSDEVDGIILVSPRAPTEALRSAIGAVPCVLVNRPLAGADCVLCSYGDAMVAAGDHLLATGHRALAMVRGPSASWAAAQRSNALRRWARRNSVPLTDVGPGPATFDTGLASVGPVVDSGATAVIAYDDMVACGVIAGLHEIGRRVPDDYAVVGCDDTLLARILTPAMTTIRTPYAELGAQAVALLSDRIESSTLDPRTVKMACSLIVRESTARPGRKGPGTAR